MFQKKKMKLEISFNAAPEILTKFQCSSAYWTIWMFYIFSFADKVFGPATTTRHVYDVTAQHVVSGAMQGINGMFPFSALLIFLEILVILISCERWDWNYCYTPIRILSGTKYLEVSFRWCR